MSKTTSLSVFVVLLDDALRRTYELIPGPPPRACYRDSQYPNNSRRADRRTRIHIPRPLLRSPECILDNRVEARFPEQERCGPRDVGVELVVQGSCAKHTDSCCSQDDRHNEVWRYPLRHDVLVSGFLGRHHKLEELAGRALGRLDPARVGEEQKQASMDSQKAESKRLREKCLLRNKAPVYGPLVEESPGEFKSASEIAKALFSEGISKKNLLQLANAFIVFVIQHTETWNMIIACVRDSLLPNA